MTSVGEILRRHGLSARKSFGQHFLHDPNVHAAIVRAADIVPGERIVEIGAGLGTLTASLRGAGAHVWAIERDRDLCPVLRETFAADPNFRLFEADAVRFDYASVADPDHPRPKVVGNLPYNLTGPLLFALLRYHAQTGPWVVMVQKEVADRICSAPGGRTYGSSSVGLQRLRHPVSICNVPPGAFVPPPKVHSAVLRFDPRPTPLGEVADVKGFHELVRAAFSRRRKTLANALAGLGDRAAVARWCAAAEVDPRLRPETIAPEGFAALQRAREAEQP